MTFAITPTLIIEIGAAIAIIGIVAKLTWKLIVTLGIIIALSGLLWIIYLAIK